MFNLNLFNSLLVVLLCILFSSALHGKKLDRHETRRILPRSTARLFFRADDNPDTWREKAVTSIEEHRKANLTIIVRSLNGAAVPDARVQIEMKKHAFLFGTCVRSKTLLIDPATKDRFQQIISQNFNSIVFENDVKWPQWIQSQDNTSTEYRLDWTEQAIEWARSRDIAIRGHTMIWGSWRWSPSNIPHDPVGLRAAATAHINDIGSRLRGSMAHWDVVNEPFSERDFTDVLGINSISDWFNLAASLDSTAKLYLNDYPWPENTEFIDYDSMVLASLIENGAPVAGFGIQAHVDINAWNIPRYLAMVDRFASHGIRTAITEYDTSIPNENTDATFLRDFMTATFAHPAMESFLVWGFWDPIHWRGQAPFFRADWSEKPAWQVYRDLVFREWWSNEEGMTDQSGSHTSRVFQGDFEVTVSKGDVSQRVSLSLGEQDRTFTIIL